ncbi:hypothetical protein ACVWZW_003982 [Bradyrhizobium sp. F1.13.4]
MKRNEKTYSARKSAAAFLLAVATLVHAPKSARAQQFSADLIARKDDTATAMGTLRVLDGKARIEATALPNGFFLIDTAKPAAYFVRPRAHVFMDARQSSALTRMFVPVDPDDPCPAMAGSRRAGLVHRSREVALSAVWRGNNCWAQHRCISNYGVVQFRLRWVDRPKAEIPGANQNLGWHGDRCRSYPRRGPTGASLRDSRELAQV